MPERFYATTSAQLLRFYATGSASASWRDSGQQYAGYAWRDAIATACADRAPIVYPRAGMVWRTEDGVTLRFIGPSLPFIESDNTINDNSIAFILQYKHFRMLFNGDARVAAEQRFLSENVDLHTDVPLCMFIPSNAVDVRKFKNLSGHLERLIATDDEGCPECHGLYRLSRSRLRATPKPFETFVLCSNVF